MNKAMRAEYLGAGRSPFVLVSAPLVRMGVSRQRARVLT